PPPMPVLNDTLGFDLERRQWTSSVNIGLPLPPGRWGAAAVWSDRARELGGMWLFGGCSLAKIFNDAWRWASASEFDEVKLLHPPETTLLPPPPPRCFHTAVLIDSGQILWMVIFGGTDGRVAFDDLNALKLMSSAGRPVGDWFQIATPDEGRPPG